MAARESEWTYVLTPSDVAEIETALSPVLSRGLDIAVIRRAGFSLPRLGAVLERLYRPFPVDRRGEVPSNRGKTTGTAAFFSCTDSASWTLCIMCRRRPPFPR